MKKLMSFGLMAMLCLIFNASTLFAQVPDNPSRVEVFLEPTSEDFSFDPIANPGVSPYTTDTALVTLVIELSTTAGINDIVVTAGNSSGGTQYLSKTFTFDDFGPFTDGTSYKREGKVVYLCLGKYYGVTSFYASATLSNGSDSSATVSTSFQP